MTAKQRSGVPWLIGALLLFVLGAGAFGLVWFTRPQGEEFPGFTPTDATDRLVARFARLVNAGDPRAQELLGARPVFEDTPVSAREANARQADFYLHSPALRIVAILPGEPDTEGKLRPSPGRYTLVTRVQGSTPPLRIRDEKGEVESPSRLFMLNPDLVVEVRDGKIHGIRSELHRD